MTPICIWYSFNRQVGADTSQVLLPEGSGSVPTGTGQMIGAEFLWWIGDVLMKPRTRIASGVLGVSCFINP
jgi:hypothetical protein